MKTIFNLLAVCGFFCAATNAGATTITYDFVGSGEGSHTFNHYSRDYVTGAVIYSDSVNETGLVTIHSNFVVDVNQYQDLTSPGLADFSYDITFGAHWLTSQSSASTNSYSDSLNTSGGYASIYQACGSSFCSWGGVLNIADEGINTASYSYYDSGAIKSVTVNYSFNQVIATSFDVSLSQINGRNFVTHIGDLVGTSKLHQSIYSYNYYYDESGVGSLLDFYTSDFLVPLTSININVDATEVPEPTPFILFGLGFFMISAQRITRKN